MNNIAGKNLHYILCLSQYLLPLTSIKTALNYVVRILFKCLVDFGMFSGLGYLNPAKRLNKTNNNL